MAAKLATFVLVLYASYLGSDFILPIFSWISSWTLLICVAWKVSQYLANRFILSKFRVVEGKGKAVLITGCGSGFGHMLALRLNELGFFVFAACHDSESAGASSLKSMAINKQAIKVIELEVTDIDDILKCKRNIEDDLRSLNLEFYGLINNAGVTDNAPIEWNADTDVEDYKKVLDVNLFALIRTCRTFLPLLRQSKGRIINVTSCAGRLTSPFLGCYATSKHAAIAFTETLNYEVNQFGINAISVEPWFYKTAMLEQERLNKNILAKFERTPKDIQDVYGEKTLKTILLFSKALSYSLIAHESTGDVIDAMVDALISFEPNPVYIVMEWQTRIAYSILFEYFPFKLRNFIVGNGNKMLKLMA